MDDVSYVYIVQDGQDKGTNIYKVGRTTETGGDTRKLNRLQTYSHGTIQYYTWNVEHNVNTIEQKIKEVFNRKYKLVRGREWFEGNILDMKKDIDSVIFPETKHKKRITIPYTCIRCGYNTVDKFLMRRHLFERKNVCPGQVNMIQMTDEIRQCILDNKVYIIETHKIQKQIVNQTIINQ